MKKEKSPEETEAGGKRSEPIMVNLADGRYEIYCPVCKMSVAPELPIAINDLVRLTNAFEAEHTHQVGQTKDMEKIS